MAHTPRFGMRSVTYAMQGRELLSKFGIQSTVVRLTPNETKEGCAFGLELARGDVSRAEDLLSKADIEFTKLSI